MVIIGGQAGGAHRPRLAKEGSDARGGSQVANRKIIEVQVLGSK